MPLCNSIVTPLYSRDSPVCIPFGIINSTTSGTIVFCSPKHTCTNVLFCNSIAYALTTIITAFAVFPTFSVFSTCTIFATFAVFATFA
jgi:hypothetical protein